MSDLTATNCGYSNDCGCGSARNDNFLGCGNSGMWIILLLLFCGCGNNNGCGSSLFGGNGNDNSCCNWIIWIFLISLFCNNGNNGCC